LAFRDLPSQYQVPQVISKFIHRASIQLELLNVHIFHRFARFKNPAMLRLRGFSEVNKLGGVVFFRFFQSDLSIEEAKQATRIKNEFGNLAF